MGNALTGDFEAVLEVAVHQVNGLLATLHQKGQGDDVPLKLLHSATLEVGRRRRPRPGRDDFGGWVVAYRMAQSPGQGGNVRSQLTGAAPPGAAKLLNAAFTDLETANTAAVAEDPPEVARGLVFAQVSTPAVSVTQGSTSEVTIHANVRAHYYPNPGTTTLPAPIHGELQAAFDVHMTASTTGRKLVVQPSGQDSKIQFIPASGSGLSIFDAGRISAQVRLLLREGLDLLPVQVPSDFPFTGFKGLGPSTRQALALPVQISGAGQPSGNIQSITQNFVGASGFAVAVSKEYVMGLIDVDKIREEITHRTVTINVDLVVGSLGLVTFHMHFSEGPTLTFKDGSIEISGKVELTSWAPDGWVTFKQAIGLQLDPATQVVTPVALGEPDVNDNWVVPHDTAVSVVKSQLAQALQDNTPAIRKVFRDGQENIANGLRNFEPNVRVPYTEVTITPDGVIVRGEIGTGPHFVLGGRPLRTRQEVVVNVGETDGGTAFTAFESWIPGGQIDRLIWSWVEYDDKRPTAWGGISKSLVDEHRFILPKPPGITALGNICLRVEGTRTLANGQVVSATGGTTCLVPEPESVMDVPSWWEPVHVPVWLPDTPEDALVKDSIAGHVTVQRDAPKAGEPTSNTIVYFADWRADKPLDTLGQALARRRNQRGSLGVIVVLPPGTFGRSRRELEAKLASMGERLPVPVQLTEDDEGGWTRTFAPKSTPSIYLVNARRQFVWKHEGEIDPGVVSAALDQHVMPAPPPRPRPLRLAVSPGDSAPDAVFQDEGGQTFALRRFRGRQVLLCFWQFWSAPCLRELRRLQDLRAKEGPDTLFIVAFHGGQEARGLGEIRKSLGLTFPLVQDFDQRIARDYGVRCWPTTVTLDEEGGVQHVQFGVDPGHGPRPGPAASPGPARG